MGGREGRGEGGARGGREGREGRWGRGRGRGGQTHVLIDEVVLVEGFGGEETCHKILKVSTKFQQSAP